MGSGDEPTSVTSGWRTSALIAVSIVQASEIEMFVAGDQVRKGAATNAVQIAEKLI